MNEPAATPVTDGPLVDIADLHFSYGARPILSGVTMQFRRWKVIAVMGGSGSGKTTILRLIGGQLRPDSGTVRVAGQEIAAMNEKALYVVRRRAPCPNPVAAGRRSGAGSWSFRSQIGRASCRERV